MKGMRSSPVVFAASLGVMGWLVSRLILPAAVDSMDRALAAALREDFSLISGTCCTDPQGRRFWLAEIRARRPGDYILESHRDDPSRDLQSTASYSLRVATAGSPRRLGLFESTALWTEDGAFAEAVVGDSIVVPVPRGDGRARHWFSLRDSSRFAAGEGANFRRSPSAPPRRPPKASEGPDLARALRYEGDHLLPLEVAVDRTMTASGYSTTYRVRGLFEAKIPGAFRLQVAAEGSPPGAVSRYPPMPMMGALAASPDQAGPSRLEIVPKGVPLAVTVPRWEAEARSTKNGRLVRSSTTEALGVDALRLRVGDRFELAFNGNYRSNPNGPEHRPTIVIREAVVADPADEPRPRDLAP